MVPASWMFKGSKLLMLECIVCRYALDESWLMDLCTHRQSRCKCISS